jgi:hypothetical protein
MIADPFLNNNNNNNNMIRNMGRDGFFENMGGFGMMNMNIGGFSNMTNFNNNNNNGVGQSISSTTIIKYYSYYIILY